MLTNAVYAEQSTWPQAWYEAAKTARQLNISAFTQSPILDRLGLPGVGQRLPEDPVISVPLHDIGQHGGTARIIALDSGMLYSAEGLLAISPDHKNVLPNLAQSWHYSDDGRQLTVKLRKGLKWSDGQPFTAADCLFMTNDLQLNTDYQPVTPLILRGLKLTAPDPWTLV